MSATSSLVTPACKIGALRRIHFSHTIVCRSSLASAAPRLPDDRPLISRLSSSIEGCIADCHCPPRLPSTVPTSLSQGWTSATGTSRHIRGHRHMQRCRDVVSVGLFCSKKCCQDNCPLSDALLLCPSSPSQHSTASCLLFRLHTSPAFQHRSCVGRCRDGVALGVGGPHRWIGPSPCSKHYWCRGVDTV